MSERFTDYTTGGAFQLSLSRNQIAALAMIAQGDQDMLGANASVTALWRKGLVAERDPNVHLDPPAGSVEITAPGLRVLELVRMVGLTNLPGDDEVVRELAEARSEAAMLREQNRRLARDNLSLAQRLRDQMMIIERLQRVDTDGKRPHLILTHSYTDEDENVAEITRRALKLEGSHA